MRTFTIVITVPDERAFSEMAATAAVRACPGAKLLRLVPWDAETLRRELLAAGKTVINAEMGCEYPAISALAQIIEQQPVRP